MAKKSIFINEAGFAECALNAPETPYILNSPATCTVGGVVATTVLTGKTIMCLLQDILAPYIQPTFSAFAVAITPQPFEVGCVVTGSKSFSWSTTTGANVAAGSVGICEVGGSLLGSGFNYNSSPQSLSIGTLTNTSPTTYTWQITGCSTQSTSFSRNVSKCSIYPVYWGVETCGIRPAVDNTLVTGGSKCMVNGCGTVTIDFNSAGQWTWVAIPASNPGGIANKICWYQTGFSNGSIGNPTDKYPDICTLNITSAQSCWSAVSYKVYMSCLAGSDSDPIQFS